MEHAKIEEQKLMSENNILQKYCNNVLHSIWLLLISGIMRPNLQKPNYANSLFLNVVILILANLLKIGISTRLLLDCLSSGDITDTDVRFYFIGVRLFSETTFKYVFKRFPINDSFLKNALFDIVVGDKKLTTVEQAVQIKNYQV